MKSKSVLMVWGLMLVLFSYSFAQVPQMINYQGKITKPSGVLVDTTTTMVFSIYADSIGGTSLWTETQSSVKVEYGVFSVLLGSVAPIPDSVFSASTRYLGIKIGNDAEMMPRKAIVSVAYAYRSSQADMADYARVLSNQFENLRIIRGTIAGSSIVAGSGFSLIYTDPGQYTITFTTPFSSVPSVIVSGRNSCPYPDPQPWFYVATVQTVSESDFTARSRGQQMGNTHNTEPIIWDFIAIGTK